MPNRMIVHKGGHVTFEPYGYEGDTCHAATKPYEDRLQGVKTSKEGEAEQTVTQGQAVQAPQQQKAGQ